MTQKIRLEAALFRKTKNRDSFVSQILYCLFFFFLFLHFLSLFVKAAQKSYPATDLPLTHLHWGARDKTLMHQHVP